MACLQTRISKRVGIPRDRGRPGPPSDFVRTFGLTTVRTDCGRGGRVARPTLGATPCARRGDSMCRSVRPQLPEVTWAALSGGPWGTGSASARGQAVRRSWRMPACGVPLPQAAETRLEGPNRCLTPNADRRCPLADGGPNRYTAHTPVRCDRRSPDRADHHAESTGTRSCTGRGPREDMRRVPPQRATAPDKPRGCGSPLRRDGPRGSDRLPSPAGRRTRDGVSGAACPEGWLRSIASAPCVITALESAAVEELFPIYRAARTQFASRACARPSSGDHVSAARIDFERGWRRHPRG